MGGCGRRAAIPWVNLAFFSPTAAPIASGPSAGLVLPCQFTTTLSGRLPPFDSRYRFGSLLIYSHLEAHLCSDSNSSTLQFAFNKKPHSCIIAGKTHHFFEATLLFFSITVLSFCGAWCYLVFLLSQTDSPPHPPHPVHQSAVREPNATSGLNNG